MEFQFSVMTERSPGEAVEAVQAALTQRKFSVLWHLHVNQTLAEKGFSLEPDIHILEVCSAPRAKEAIETNPLVAAFLPCKIIVSQVNGRTEIGLTRPTILMSILGDERLKGLADEVEATLIEAVKAAQ